MLVRVEVRTAQSTLLLLPLDDDSNGFAIQDIEGLDPVKATLVSSSFAQMDGAQYHSSRREPRNLKIKLGLAPNYVSNSIRELRNSLYAFFMPKMAVDLRFVMLDDSYVDISGRVETLETPLFSKEPGVDISFMCFDPDFYDPIPVLLSGASTSDLTEMPVVYAGTVETGFIFTMTATRILPSFTIFHTLPDGSVEILDFTEDLIIGDLLVISTIAGSKSAMRTRGGFVNSVLYGVTPTSAWLELQPGENSIRVYAEGDSIPYEIEYITKYGGL